MAERGSGLTVGRFNPRFPGLVFPGEIVEVNAQSFELLSFSTRYLRLDFTDAVFRDFQIGELAFGVEPVAVPDSRYSLLLGALLLFVFRRRPHAELRVA